MRPLLPATCGALLSHHHEPTARGARSHLCACATPRALTAPSPGAGTCRAPGCPWRYLSSSSDSVRAPAPRGPCPPPSPPPRRRGQETRGRGVSRRLRPQLPAWRGARGRSGGAGGGGRGGADGGAGGAARGGAGRGGGRPALRLQGFRVWVLNQPARPPAGIKAPLASPLRLGPMETPPAALGPRRGELYAVERGARTGEGAGRVPLNQPDGEARGAGPLRPRGLSGPSPT